MNKQIEIIIIIVFLVVATFFGCSKNKDKNALVKKEFDSIGYSEENVSPLEIVNKRDTLIITFQGTDCGEWGGHKETIFLQRQDNNQITARILIDEVPCDDIVEKNGGGILNPDKRKIIVDYTKVIDLEDEKLFSKFLQRLLELYLKPVVVGNYGSCYEVRNTDNSLYFSYWNSGNEMNTYYWVLKKEVFSELKRIPVASK